MAGDGGSVIVIPWVANPFRGDRFEEMWLPRAEAVMRYGAHGWAFFRSKEGLLDFTQIAFFDTKLDFERYWYSDEMASARAEASGLYQVPILPEYHQIAGIGGAPPPAG